MPITQGKPDRCNLPKYTVIVAIFILHPSLGTAETPLKSITTNTSQKISHAADSQLTPVTPYSVRFAVEAGDQAGGPVRYNTRFPSAAGDPNPTSYYHAQAFIGVSFEKSFATGALQIGALSRRDLAHRKIVDRMDVGPDGSSWTVKTLEFRSDALTLGWVFGRMYREAPWRVSLASVVDVAEVSAALSDENRRFINNESRLVALSLRGRGMWRVLGRGAGDIHIGPELHIPVYSKESHAVNDEAGEWIHDQIALKNSAAIGMLVELGLRF